jgi:putative intracellular protease/amidase
MPKTLPRKALISISSFSGAIYPGGLKTGLFYTEALHPFEVLTDAGFEVDLASETGTCGIDEVSLMLQFLKRFLATQSIRSMSSFTRDSRRPRS